MIATEGMFSNKDNKNSSTDSSSTGYDYQLHLGYITSQSFYFGGLYSGNKNTVKTKTSTTQTTSKSSLSIYGPDLGYYFQNGVFLHGAYYLDATKDEGSETSSVVYEGDGFQAQLGFLAKAGGLKLTISIVYRSYQWKKRAGVNITTKTRTTETQPYLGLIFKF